MMLADGERVEVRIPVIGKCITDPLGNVLCRFDAALVESWLEKLADRRILIDPLDILNLWRIPDAGMMATDLRLEGDDLVGVTDVKNLVCYQDDQGRRYGELGLILQFPDRLGRPIPELIALCPIARPFSRAESVAVDWPPARETL